MHDTPHPLSDNEAWDYSTAFGEWKNNGNAQFGYPFILDVIESTYDTMVAITSLMYSQTNADETGWMRGISVDTYKPGEGAVTPGEYDWVQGSDYNSDVEDVFDGDVNSVYDSYGTSGTWPTAHWVMYAATDTLLLTHYQVSVVSILLPTTTNANATAAQPATAATVYKYTI